MPLICFQFIRNPIIFHKLLNNQCYCDYKFFFSSSSTRSLHLKILNLFDYLNHPLPRWWNNKKQPCYTSGCIRTLNSWTNVFFKRSIQIWNTLPKKNQKYKIYSEKENEDSICGTFQKYIGWNWARRKTMDWLPLQLTKYDMSKFDMTLPYNLIIILVILHYSWDVIMILILLWCHGSYIPSRI